MKETVYYYKDSQGRFHFSNGVVKDESKAGEYLRMLRYAKYPTEALYLDRDFEKIKSVFKKENEWRGRTWIEVYEN